MVARVGRLRPFLRAHSAYDVAWHQFRVAERQHWISRHIIQRLKELEELQNVDWACSKAVRQPPRTWVHGLAFGVSDDLSYLIRELIRCDWPSSTHSPNEMNPLFFKISSIEPFLFQLTAGYCSA